MKERSSSSSSSSVAKICRNTRVQIILVLILFSEITKGISFWDSLFRKDYTLIFENHLSGNDSKKEMVVTCFENRIIKMPPVEIKPNPVASYSFMPNWDSFPITCYVNLPGYSYSPRFIAFIHDFDCNYEMDCTWQIYKYHPYLYEPSRKRFVKHDYFY